MNACRNIFACFTVEKLVQFEFGLDICVLCAFKIYYWCIKLCVNKTRGKTVIYWTVIICPFVLISVNYPKIFWFDCTEENRPHQKYTPTHKHTRKTINMMCLMKSVVAVLMVGSMILVNRVDCGSCRESTLCCNGRDSSCVVQKAPINSIIEDLNDKPCYCDHACLRLGDCCSDFKQYCGGK